MAVSREKLIKAIVARTGYAEEDIIGLNTTTLGFTTSNGGKYILSPDGKDVRKLMGPDYPKATPAVETPAVEEPDEE